VAFQTFQLAYRYVYEPGTSVSIVSGYGLDHRKIEVLSPAETKEFFPLASVSRSALQRTQPPVQWVLGVLSLGVERGRDVTLTTHLQAPMSRAILLLPPSAFMECSGTALAFIPIRPNKV
jgi:hypothetical protein